MYVLMVASRCNLEKLQNAPNIIMEIFSDPSAASVVNSYNIIQIFSVSHARHVNVRNISSDIPANSLTTHLSPHRTGAYFIGAGCLVVQRNVFFQYFAELPLQKCGNHCTFRLDQSLVFSNNVFVRVLISAIYITAWSEIVPAIKVMYVQCNCVFGIILL